MTRNWNAVRTALALPLSALLLAGCFWLEPISPYPDGGDSGPDGGTTSDGGSDTDGGTEPEPLACGEDTPVPAGARVDFPAGDRGWMYLEPGNELIPGNSGLKLTLSQPHAAEVPVELRSSQRGVVEPESEWFCFPPHATEVVVRLQAHDLGNAVLEARVGAEVNASMNVTVVNGAPTFTVSPNHGYYNPGELTDVTVQLSHPSREAVILQASDTATDSVFKTWELEAGLLEYSTEFEFLDIPAMQLRLHSEELDGTVDTDFRRAPQHILISEVLLGDQAGFVELYNPTDGQLSLEGLQLSLRQGGGKHVTVTTFVEGHAVEAYSYFLVGWGPIAVVPTLEITRPSELDKGRRLILGVGNSNGNGFSSYVDGLKFEGFFINSGRSLERKAWPTANADSMRNGGEYEGVGHAHDTKDGNPEDDSIGDFVDQLMPGPQNTFSPAESFFGP